MVIFGHPYRIPRLRLLLSTLWKATFPDITRAIHFPARLRSLLVLMDCSAFQSVGFVMNMKIVMMVQMNLSLSVLRHVYLKCLLVLMARNVFSS